MMWLTIATWLFRLLGLVAWAEKLEQRYKEKKAENVETTINRASADAVDRLLRHDFSRKD